MTHAKEEQGPSPVELSRALNCIACSLSVKREDPIAIFHLVMEARDYMKCLWNCVQFWLCCVATLSLVQALSGFLMLPPLLSVGQSLWLICLIIPLLSVSMIATPTDPTIMQRATGKNQCAITGEVALFVLWCYGCKFLPTIITVIVCQLLMYMILCTYYVRGESQCFYVYPDTSGAVYWGGWNDEPNIIMLVQHVALTLLVLHFVIISVSFVHREYSIWRRWPFNNWPWCLNAFIVLTLQAIFSGNLLYSILKEEQQKIDNFPIHLPLFFFISLPLVCAINELVKWQEIKANVRYQKRARLEFGTKLGMNSPF